MLFVLRVDSLKIESISPQIHSKLNFNFNLN